VIGWLVIPALFLLALAGIAVSTRLVVHVDPEHYRWKALAGYNAERSRGITHLPEYDARMAREQAEFDAEHTNPSCPMCGVPAAYKICTWADRKPVAFACEDHGEFAR
jgi:hypothetical protein